MAARAMPIPIPIEAPVERDDECVLGVELPGVEDVVEVEVVEEDVELGAEPEPEVDLISEGVEEAAELMLKVEGLELVAEDPATTTCPPCTLPAEEEEEASSAADL